MTIPYNIKPNQLVEVHWLDPAAASDWKDTEAISFYEFKCRSVGWVYLLNDTGVVLTACDGTDPDNNLSSLLRQHIPWGCIQDLWVFEIEGAK